MPRDRCSPNTEGCSGSPDVPATTLVLPKFQAHAPKGLTVPYYKLVAADHYTRENTLELSEVRASMRKSDSPGVIFMMRFTMSIVMCYMHTIRSW